MEIRLASVAFRPKAAGSATNLCRGDINTGTRIAKKTYKTVGSGV
jgi:hypothetical protein